MNVKPMMKKIWNWLQGLFRKKPREIEARAALEMMVVTHDQELTCDEVHALLDQFAEMHFRGENPAHLFPLVQRHLDMCPDCREEFEALLTALAVEK
jgi:hypothetical protein